MKQHKGGSYQVGRFTIRQDVGASQTWRVFNAKSELVYAVAAVNAQELAFDYARRESAVRPLLSPARLWVVKRQRDGRYLVIRQDNSEKDEPTFFFKWGAEALADFRNGVEAK